MCGIAGIVGAINDRNQNALRRMTAALTHRGPDRAGFWTSEPDHDGHGCLLGHRRLSILDLTAAADQPMSTSVADRSYTMVFNGEIYNFKTLRTDLEARGECLRSSGDTAVLLRLLALEGTSAVIKLRGMFAFGFWDAAARQLVLARDPLGIKPLYVCRNSDPRGDWSVLFSSEVRSLLAAGLSGKPRLDPRAVASMLWNGFVAGPNTAVEGIEMMRPGEVRIVERRRTGLTTDTRQTHTRRRVEGPQTSIEAVRAALEESVRLHTVSDVPLGVFLSGGVDSSVVANLARRVGAGPVHTFTLAFEEEAFNEGPASRAIARAIGTDHREIVLTEQEFVRSLDRSLAALDQPTFDGLNSYYISRAVREAGVTVALLGTGGDELFGGYSTFQVLPRMEAWARRLRPVPMGLKLMAARAAAAVATGRGRGSAIPQTRWAKLPDMIRCDGDWLGLYQHAYALFLPEFQERLLANRDIAVGMHHGLGPELQAELRRDIAGRSSLDTISALEQRLYLTERLLRDTDAASMAVSLETRLPLVDRAVLDVVERLPDNVRFSPVGRKQLLRTVGLDGIDPALFEHPKQGFVLPFDTWIRRSLGAAMDDTMRDERLARAVGLDSATVVKLWQAYQQGAPGLYWNRVWAIYVLMNWCLRHDVVL
jgi:asparagine synthase (glutamine-hydrolysing)